MTARRRIAAKERKQQVGSGGAQESGGAVAIWDCEQALCLLQCSDDKYASQGLSIQVQCDATCWIR